MTGGRGSVEVAGNLGEGALLRRLRGGVVALALLAGGGLVVPGRVGAQRWRIVEAVLVVDAVGGVKLRVLQPRDQALIFIPKLASHQCGLTHHHHILHGKKTRAQKLMWFDVGGKKRVYSKTTLSFLIYKIDTPWKTILLLILSM